MIEPQGKECIQREVVIAMKSSLWIKKDSENNTLMNNKKAINCNSTNKKLMTMSRFQEDSNQFKMNKIIKEKANTMKHKGNKILSNKLNLLTKSMIRTNRVLNNDNITDSS